nr:MAG TPA: hypothetical protein [Caudoviricetes sp.]
MKRKYKKYCFDQPNHKTNRRNVEISTFYDFYNAILMQLDFYSDIFKIKI